MKKMAVFAMLGLMLVCAACGKKEEKAPAAAEAAQETEAAEPVGMANPWTEIEFDKMCEEIGYTFNLPEGAEDVSCQIMKEQGMGQVICTVNGVEITCRIQSTAEFTDISGLYYDWEIKEDAKVDRCDAKTFRHIGEDETIDLCLWYDVAPGIMYSVSACAPDLDGFDIVAIAQQVFEPMQGEA